VKSFIVIAALAAASVWWLAGKSSDRSSQVSQGMTIKAVAMSPAEVKAGAVKTLNASAGSAAAGERAPSAFASVSNTYAAKFGEEDTASVPGGRTPAAIATASARILTMVDNSISRITQGHDRERTGVRESMRTHGVPDTLIEELFKREQQTASALNALEAQEKKISATDFAAREDEIFRKHTEWIYANISPYFAE
jgi:hypothetical protein